MKTLFLLLLVVGVFLSCHETDARATRRKRNVLELDEVISCVTGMSAIQVWLKLDGYGCYCGFGGEGTPLDDVDECCQRHDNCYDEAQTNGNCPDNAIYTTTYQYKKLCKSEDRDGEITCKLEDTYKNPEVGRCAQELCGCDVELGLCLREKELNSAYEKYNKESCHVK